MDQYEVLRNGNVVFSVELAEEVFDKVATDATEANVDVIDYIRFKINQLLEGSDYTLA